jgi:hypothetical protein
VRASTDLPSNVVVQCEGKQTSGGKDWMALVIAIIALAGVVAGAVVTWRMNESIAGKTRGMNESIADKTRGMNESIATMTGEMNKNIATMTADMNRLIAKETGEMNANLATRIEDLKKGLEFRLSSDRTILDKRMHHYEQLLAVLKNFPKYPEPRSLSIAELKGVATELQGLYFDGAGIYMSEEVRDGYFDLQDGIRIVLSKAEQIKPPLEIPQDDAMKLREMLGRSEGWKVPAEITELCKLTSIVEARQSDMLPWEALESIRKLGSGLRGCMAADLDSRRELSDRGAQQPGTLA